MLWQGLLVTLSVSVKCSFALYSSSSPVTVLNAQQYQKLIASEVPLLVEFYSPTCGHCRSFAPDYEKIAKALKNVVKVVAVDDQAILGQQKVAGVPTIKFIVGNTVSTPHAGPRVVPGLVTFALDQLRALAVARLSDGGSGGQKSKAKATPNGDDSDSSPSMVVLNDSTFASKLKAQKDMTWFILFEASWCGYCKAMKADWARAGEEMRGLVQFARIDASENPVVARQFNINSFPTIYLIQADTNREWNELPNVAVPYNGERKLKEFVAFAAQYVKFTKEAAQLTSQDQFTELCKKGVCVVAFLPHILDTTAAARDAEVSILQDVMKATVELPVQWLWSEGGSQFDLEEKLHLQFGFPAVVAFNLEKERHTIFKGSFKATELRSFINRLMAGRQSVSPLPENLPKIQSVEPWDGKDAPIEVDDTGATETHEDVREGSDEL